MIRFLFLSTPCLTRRTENLLRFLSIAGLLLLFGCSERDKPLVFEAGFISRGVVENPSDIIRYNGKYIIPEIYNNRLAIIDSIDAKANEVTYFDGKNIGKEIKAPHNLAISPWGTLLVSNGWGSSIFEIDGLDGSGWQEFFGIDKKLRAPHGICVDKEGWIYVGDSLNSRLVRFKDMQGKDWQVFADHDKKISYVRQLVCNEDGVWAANSYEKRKGLNPGQGSNALLISDFNSGKVQEIVKVPGDNMVGVQPLDDQIAITLWHGYPNIGIFEKQNQNNVIKFTDFPLELGTPYSVYHESDKNRMIFAFFGALKDKGKANPGGLAELKIR